MEITNSGGTLRERTRQAIRNEIAETAFTLYVERGFEETTIDDIVRAAGLSRRSFFRYFHSKEDPVLDVLATVGTEMAETLRNRPPEEDIWEALRVAFRDPPRNGITEEHLFGRVRLIQETPALLNTLFEHQSRWHKQVSAVLEERSAGKLDALTIDVIVMAALGASNAAHRAWTQMEGKVSLAELTDRAFGIIAPTVL